MIGNASRLGGPPTPSQALQIPMQQRSLTPQTYLNEELLLDRFLEWAQSAVYQRALLSSGS